MASICIYKALRVEWYVFKKYKPIFRDRMWLLKCIPHGWQPADRPSVTSSRPSVLSGGSTMMSIGVPKLLNRCLCEPSAVAALQMMTSLILRQ